MVRSMPLRGGRPQAPTAPTRRQLQSLASAAESPAQPSEPAKLVQGAIGGGRVRSAGDQRQPGWVRRDKGATTSVPFNLSRSSLPLTHRQHPLTDAAANARLRDYEQEVKGRFDRIVPLPVSYTHLTLPTKQPV